MRIITFIAVGLCLYSISLDAQKVISGTIRDLGDDSPLVGATILLKDTESIGTVSDAEGNFSLQVPEKATTLV